MGNTRYASLFSCVVSAIKFTVVCCQCCLSLYVAIATCHRMFPLLLATACCHCCLPLNVAIAACHCMLPCCCHCRLPLHVASVACHCMMPLLLANISWHCMMPLLIVTACFHCKSFYRMAYHVAIAYSINRCNKLLHFSTSDSCCMMTLPITTSCCHCKMQHVTTACYHFRLLLHFVIADL